MWVGGRVGVRQGVWVASPPEGMQGDGAIVTATGHQIQS